jgi:cyclase
MRRILGLGSLVTAAVLMTAATNDAQQARSRIRPVKLADNLYLLSSDPAEQGMRTGGNTAVFVTAKGVTLVDTKIKGYGQDILAQVRKITDKPVTTVINTHTHWDHTGANTEFPDTVDFVVHENTLKHLSRQTCDDGTGFQGGSITNCDAFKGANAKYLPKTTFSTTRTLFSGPDQIDLYYFGRGHTDGDTFVVFRAARTMHTGDMFARKGLPFIDAANSNGSATEFGNTLNKAVAGVANVDTIITGHADEPHTWKDLTEYAGFYNDLASQAQKGKAAGRSVADVVKAYQLPDRYRDFQVPGDRLQNIVQLIFEGR